jgi:hypothetical protein
MITAGVNAAGQREILGPSARPTGALQASLLRHDLDDPELRVQVRMAVARAVLLVVAGRREGNWLVSAGLGP